MNVSNALHAYQKTDGLLLLRANQQEHIQAGNREDGIQVIYTFDLVDENGKYQGQLTISQKDGNVVGSDINDEGAGSDYEFKNEEDKKNFEEGTK